MSVFIIVNEWESIGSGGSEVVDSKYFTSEDSAHEALSLIAQALGQELSPDATSVSREVNEVYDEYYIQELTLGD